MTVKSAHVTLRAKEFPDFVVDRAHGTLINTNVNRLKAYKLQRDRITTSARRLVELESQLHMMQSQMKVLFAAHTLQTEFNGTLQDLNTDVKSK